MSDPYGMFGPSDFEVHEKRLDSLRKRISELEAEIARKDEALKYYARGAAVIGFDHGDIARAALGEKEGVK
jgi:exonuclease VII small subunit